MASVYKLGLLELLGLLASPQQLKKKFSIGFPPLEIVSKKRKKKKKSFKTTKLQTVLIT